MYQFVCFSKVDYFYALHTWLWLILHKLPQECGFKWRWLAKALLGAQVCVVGPHLRAFVAIIPVTFFWFSYLFSWRYHMLYISVINANLCSCIDLLANRQGHHHCGSMILLGIQHLTVQSIFFLFMLCCSACSQSRGAAYVFISGQNKWAPIWPSNACRLLGEESACVEQNKKEKERVHQDEGHLKR